MKTIDYIILILIFSLLIVDIIYLIQNKGCPTSTCKSCKSKYACKKIKKLVKKKKEKGN